MNMINFVLMAMWLQQAGVLYTFHECNISRSPPPLSLSLSLSLLYTIYTYPHNIHQGILYLPRMVP